MISEKAANYYSSLKDNYNDGFWWRSRALPFALVTPIHRIYPGYRDSINIVDEEWDNLLVLDSCRADLFEEVFDVDRFDSYERKTSIGSATAEWTRRNFADVQLGDTVYVSSNPVTSRIANDSFHKLVEVWEDSFDEELGTVPAPPVTQAAKEAYEANSDKRLIIHFMQPHCPFIESELPHFTGLDPDRIAESRGNDKEPPYSIWDALHMGIIDQEELWEGYKANLEYVVDEVNELIETLDGTTVVTSDHGNAIGERAWPVPLKLYGHLVNIRSPSMTEVPWGVVDGDSREITEGEINAIERDTGEIEERLEDLGYV